MMQFGLLMFFAASTASGDVAFAVGASTALALSYAAYHVVVVNGQCLPRRQACPFSLSLSLSLSLRHMYRDGIGIAGPDEGCFEVGSKQQIRLCLNPKP